MLAFAKLNFLRGLDLVAEADYEACVQSADPANEDGPGHLVGQTGELLADTVRGKRLILVVEHLDICLDILKHRLRSIAPFETRRHGSRVARIRTLPVVALVAAVSAVCDLRARLHLVPGAATRPSLPW